MSAPHTAPPRPAGTVNMLDVFTADELETIAGYCGTWVHTRPTVPAIAWSPLLERLDLPDLAARARSALASGGER